MLPKCFFHLTGLALPCVVALVLLVAGDAKAQTASEDSLQESVITNVDAPELSHLELKSASSPPTSTDGSKSPDSRPSLTQRFPALDKLKNQGVQFTDVTRKDWAYEPISALMQRYGCISGYPDGTFRGQQALTRNEFAAGLESCMSRMDKIIQDKTANLVTREDLATLFRILSTIFENSPTVPKTVPQSPPTQSPGTLPSPGSSPQGL